MVVVLQCHPRGIVPGLPAALCAMATEQSALGDHNQAFHKPQIGIQVNLQRGQNVLLGAELLLHFGEPLARDIRQMRVRDRR